MQGDVKHIITDFGLGTSTVKGEGVHIKLGVSHIESNVPITINNTMTSDDIRNKLGKSPLSDSLIDSINAGVETVYAMPIKKSVDGEINTKINTEPFLIE